MDRDDRINELIAADELTDEQFSILEALLQHYKEKLSLLQSVYRRQTGKFWHIT